MPNQSIEFRIEYVHRQAKAVQGPNSPNAGTDVGYFAGAGGVTSPTGYTTTAFGPGTAYPIGHLILKHENRFIFAILFRI